MIRGKWNNEAKVVQWALDHWGILDRCGVDQWGILDRCGARPIEELDQWGGEDRKKWIDEANRCGSMCGAILDRWASIACV